jgi:hypothetical protein
VDEVRVAIPSIDPADDIFRHCVGSVCKEACHKHRTMECFRRSPFRSDRKVLSGRNQRAIGCHIPSSAALS